MNYLVIVRLLGTCSAKCCITTNVAARETLLRFNFCAGIMLTERPSVNHPAANTVVKSSKTSSRARSPASGARFQRRYEDLKAAHEEEKAAHCSTRETLAECRRERDLLNLVVEDFRSLVAVMEEEAEAHRQELKSSRDTLEARRQRGPSTECAATQTVCDVCDTASQSSLASQGEAGCQTEVMAEDSVLSEVF